MSNRTITVTERIGHRMFLVELEAGAIDKLPIESLERAEARGTPVTWLIEKPAEYDDNVRIRRESNR